MQIQLVPYLLLIGFGSLVCIFWFYFTDRKTCSAGNSFRLSLLILFLGSLLGLGCARVFWVLFRCFMHPAFFVLRAEELSYYGGVAGVALAVCLAAKCCGRKPGTVLNTFAPAGAFLAAIFRFAEGFLGMLGFGRYLDNGIFFPVTVELYDEFFSEYYLAVFMLEGLLSLGAMVFSLMHRTEKDCFLRTLFYLCLPQILCESLRIQSIRWLFIRTEQLICYLFCEIILIGYAVRHKPNRFLSWIPALAGLGICGFIVAIEYALDGKITVGGKAIPHLLLYGIMALLLVGMAVAEHKGRSRK